MSANAAFAPARAIPAQNDERAHRIRLNIAYAVTIALLVALAIYGFDYYSLSSADRPYSPKRHMLLPSGTIGLKLGFVGTAMFLIIFLYPLRKRWNWLAKQGQSRHWLDFHVLLGLAAPLVIALHSSFKFRGVAGIAFWIMLAVSLSGIIGRYVYSQIPRSLNAAELTMKELKELQAQMAQKIAPNNQLTEADLRSLFRLPSPDRVARLPLLVALFYMMALDLARPFRIARLRRHSIRIGEKFSTLGGFLTTRHYDLEQTIASAHDEAALAKRIVFLSRSQQVFHLWHVIHKPFSYSFAILALFHIGVVMVMGYL